MKRIFALFLSCFLVLVFTVSADDSIPDNCENTTGDFFRENLFARVAENGDILLVDWTTGDTILTLTTPKDAQTTYIGEWSPDCAYLTGTQLISIVDNLPQYHTLVWDTRTATLIASFDDARRIPHPTTWSDNSDYLLVEGRNGAFVWRASTQTQVHLSSGADSNAQTFFSNSLTWDYDKRQLSGTLTFEQFGTAIYSLETGELLAISDEWGRALDLDRVQFSVATAKATGEDYPCRPLGPQGLDAIYDVNNKRVVLRDSTSNEVIKVVESNITLNLFRAVSYAPSCQYMKASVILGNDTRETTMIWDLWRSVPARIFTIGDAHERPHRIYWSPDSNYAIIKTRLDARLLNLLSAESSRLTADLTSDCFRHYKGCSGTALAFHYVGWDMPSNLLQLDLIFGNIVKFDLNTGAPVTILDNQGQFVSADREYVVRQRLNSPFGCTHDFFYHATNNTFAIKDWLIGEEVFIVDDNLDAWSFEQAEYSPTCNYVAAKVGLEGQSDESIIIWSLVTGERLGIVDVGKAAVDVRWLADGKTATINTSDITYNWNLITNSITIDS